VPIKDRRDGDVHGTVTDRGLALKFLVSGREALGNPSIESPAVILKEPDEEDIAERELSPPSDVGRAKSVYGLRDSLIR
jgi:hypothetical protein